MSQRVVSTILMVAGLVSANASQAQTTATEGAQLAAMRTTAIAWRNSLSAELKTAGVFPFEADLRTDWHFIPKQRQGVAWKDMNLDQRRAAHDLLRAALSRQGYFKALTIMSLEQDLRRLESDRENVENVRDPEKYWFAIFGDPESSEPWGWRVEGHHLSLNFSSVEGQVVSVTPAFFGANPAELRDGQRAGLRVLGPEEDLARELVASLDQRQQSDAIISEQAPDDVLLVPDAEIKLGQPEGLSAADMRRAQRQKLMRLTSMIAGNFHASLRKRTMTSLRAVEPDQLHFAWAGSTDPGQRHYFRIHGPTMVIEYDNTQNNANHAHLVWHSTDNDFGLDFLKRHYADSPHHQQAP